MESPLSQSGKIHELELGVWSGNYNILGTFFPAILTIFCMRCIKKIRLLPLIQREIFFAIDYRS